jgi:hypothetical protein
VESRPGLFNRIVVRILESFSAALGRKEGEGPVIVASRTIRGKTFVLLAVYFALAIGLGYGFVPFRQEILKTTPEIKFENSTWRTLFESTECSEDGSIRSCPAHPENPRLWTSTSRRSDPGHYDSTRQRKGKEFWLGAVVTPEMLDRASALGANHLLLGWINSTFELWIDGALYTRENGVRRKVPFYVALPKARVSSEKPMHIGIRIDYDSEFVFPDFFRNEGAGLASAEIVQNSLRQFSFQGETRPTLIVGVFLVIGLSFTFFWASSPARQEYWYLALFALIQSAVQLHSSNFIWRAFSRETVYGVGVFTYFFEAAFALFLGFAYGRARIAIFKYGILLTATVPGILVIIFQSSVSRLQMMDSITAYLMPTSAATGAIFCFAQAAVIAFTKTNVRVPRMRIFNLLVFGSGLFFLTLSYLARSIPEFSATYAFRDPLFHSLIVGFLSFVVILHYREQERLLEKTPISEFHKRLPLPNVIRGTGLSIDVKQSAKVRQIYGDEVYFNVINTWFSALCGEIRLFGGEAIVDGGDSVVAFFEGEAISTTMQAIRAASRCESVQVDVQRNLGLKVNLEFRSALFSGEISPIWKPTGKIRHPAFNGNVLVELSRLIELERNLDTPGSILLLDEVDYLKVSGDPEVRKYDFREASIRDKDGRLRKIHWAELEVANPPLNISAMGTAA